MVWMLVCIYIVCVVLLHVPTVQQYAGLKVSEALSSKLGTQVTVGRIDLGFLNRIIVDDVLIKDQQKRDMISSHRLSAKVSIIDILQGSISITSAQIFSLTANIIKPSEQQPLNCQFIIDSLQSKDTTTHTPLDLHIGSLVIRNTNVTYNQLDKPVSHNTFDVNHLDLRNLSVHLLLNTLTDDSLSVCLKRLSVDEHNSGLNIKRLAFEAIADRKNVTLRDMNLVTDNSQLSLSASAVTDSNRIKSYKAIVSNSKVSTKDVALFVPKLAHTNHTILVNADIDGTDNSLDINSLNIKATDNILTLKGSGTVYSFTNKAWKANIPVLHVDGSKADDIITAFSLQGSHDIISKVGFVDASITASGIGSYNEAKANINTAIGKVSANYRLAGKHLTAKVNTGNLKIGTLLNTTNIGDVDASLNLQTDIVGGNRIVANTKAKLLTPLITLGKNTFRNISLNLEQKGDGATADMKLADLNVNADINVSTTNLPAVINAITKKGNNAAPVRMKADIAHINPHALGLTAKWPSRSYSTSLDIDVHDILNPINGLIANISNFHMSDNEESYHLDNLTLSSLSDTSGTKTINLDADFANATIDGKFDINSLKHAVTNLIASRLPTLPGLPKTQAVDSYFRIDASVSDTDILQKLLGINVSIARPVTLKGFLDSRSGLSDITLDAPSVTYDETTYTDTRVHVFSPDDILYIIANTARQDDNGTPFKAQYEGQAIDNHLNSVISWESGDDLFGNLRASSLFMTNSLGKTQACINILPSEIMVGDTAWQVRPSTANYYADHLEVNNFSIEHGRQHIHINGTATPSSNDTLVANLRDVNVGYILDLVNFHSVEFDGLATGTATATALFSKPEAKADLTVRNFLFEQGRMGTLHAKAEWDNELGQINIDALSDDSPGKTKIDGYVSIKRNYIDLDIKADRTRLEFVKGYCESFCDRLDAEGTGNARVFGDLSTVNLSGNIVANGSMHISSLNTDYTLRNTKVTMIPDEIMINRDSIFDNKGGYALVSGALHHKHLTRMTFDFDIDAHHLLCYDFPELNGEVFCGHCVATGNCKIKGLPGEIIFDIDAYPEATSEIVYNVSSPDALQNQEFITWRDPSLTNTKTAIAKAVQHEQEEAEDNDFRTNMRLNFLIHCTPASTLRLIMDQRTGDFITLNGNGTLRATWFNKGGMQIFGNYIVDRGTYKMTMQQVITKNFEFQPEGSIIFGGDPLEAALNLQALYVVPSVSLSDLNLGSSLSSGTVRVNCLMNITGTADHPVVDFDLALPNASTDIQQMITSLMDSEEERTQQVLYLLSIGRFYAANRIANDASTTQTSLAMQSFLSGTLSQQLNNIISDQLLKSRNWNFGANISPGDEGMNNAEYEGLINGRLFNDRLLINGQFGYRDNVNTASSSFIGDFDVRYLITPNGNIQIKIYNQATDRYFIKNNLNTQGIGIILKHDFDYLVPKFLRRKK